MPSAFVLVAVALLGSTPVGSSWRAPEDGCPSAAELDARILALLGRAPDASVVVDAAVTRESEGFRLELRVATPSGTTARSLWAQSCRTLAEVTAVVVAIAVDPSAIASTIERRRAQPPSPVRPPTPLATQRPALRGHLRLGAGVGGGELPSFGGQAMLALGILRGALRLELYGGYALAREHHVVGARGPAGGSFELWFGGLRGCGAPRLGRVELPICLATEGGAVRGLGLGIVDPEVDVRAWAALAAGPFVVLPVHRHLALLAGAEVVLPVLRPGFSVEGVGAIWRAPPVGGRGQVGLEVRFP